VLYFIINPYELFGSAVCQENFVRRADPRLNWTPPAGCLTFNEEILEHPGAAPGALAIENLDPAAQLPAPEAEALLYDGVTD
jgi:hypothetical protein